LGHGASPVPSIGRRGYSSAGRLERGKVIA